MTPYEYACHLSQLIDEDPPEQSSEIFELSEHFYGLFQCFMPDGEGAENIFLPLDNGAALWQRLRPIYETTAARTKAAIAEDYIPGYFVPATVDDPQTLTDLGQQLLANLRHFVTYCEHDTLLDALKNITHIRIDAQRPERSEIDDLLYDTLTDWRSDHIDFESLFAVLDEAYYSINCDYWLAAYLQYPAIPHKPSIDFLAPYFKLWQLGRNFSLQNNTLIIHEI